MSYRKLKGLPTPQWDASRYNETARAERLSRAKQLKEAFMRGLATKKHQEEQELMFFDTYMEKMQNNKRVARQKNAAKQQLRWMRKYDTKHGHHYFPPNSKRRYHYNQYDHKWERWANRTPVRYKDHEDYEEEDIN